MYMYSTHTGGRELGQWEWLEVDPMGDGLVPMWQNSGVVLRSCSETAKGQYLSGVG